MWNNTSNGTFFPLENHYLHVFLCHWIFLGFVLIRSRPVYFSFWLPKKTPHPHYSAALTPAQRSISLQSPEGSKTLSNLASQEASTDFFLPEPPARQRHQGQTGRMGSMVGSAAARLAGIGTGSAKHKTFINERPCNWGRIDPAVNHLEGETCAQKGNPRLPKVRSTTSYKTPPLRLDGNGAMTYFIADRMGKPGFAQDTILITNKAKLCRPSLGQGWAFFGPGSVWGHP